MAPTYKVITYSQARSDVEDLLAQLCEYRGRRFPGGGEQVRALWQFLTTRTDWLRAPASTKYHLCCHGGLLIHSVGVMNKALDLCGVLAPEIPLDSIILCSLFHDVGKVWGNTVVMDEITRHPDRPDEHNQVCSLSPRYEPNWGCNTDAQPYNYVKGGVEMEIATRSLRLIEKFVDLTDAEAQAIQGHDFLYIESNRHYAHKEDPLLLLVAYADTWVGHVIEGQLDVNANNRFQFTDKFQYFSE